MKILRAHECALYLFPNIFAYDPVGTISSKIIVSVKTQKRMMIKLTTMYATYIRYFPNGLLSIELLRKCTLQVHLF